MLTSEPKPVLPTFDGETSFDQAWSLSNAGSFDDHDLRDGDTVQLKADTRGEFAAGNFIVPGGTLGTVTEARANRPTIAVGETARHYAKVDVIIEGCLGHIKVPHVALRVLNQVTPRPDWIGRRS
jgi:hypothetical protein